jgi:hypothetical protein
MGDCELAWTGSRAIDDSGDVDIKRGETFGAWVEQAIGSQDWVKISNDKSKFRYILTVNQGEGILSSDETIFALEGDGDSAHTSIVIGTFLVFLHVDAGKVDSRHFILTRKAGL